MSRALWNWKRRMAVAVCLVLVAGLLGCQTPAGRSAGQVVDDSTITTKVKAKLLDDPDVSGLAVSVETFEGTVTLTGAVDTPAQRAKAENIARATQGVRGVNNLLKLK